MVNCIPIRCCIHNLTNKLKSLTIAGYSPLSIEIIRLALLGNAR